MSRFLPKTLRGQLVLMIFTTFVVVQSVSLWLFVDERSLAVRSALELETADRTANVVRLLDSAPAELRGDILEAANSPLVLFSIAPEAAVTHQQHDAGGAVAARVQGLLEEGPDRDIRVELHELDARNPVRLGNPNIQKMHKKMMGANLSSVEMQVSVALHDGNWLNVTTRFHSPSVLWPWESILSFALATLIIMVAVWITLNRLTGPIRKLAVSADKFGRGEDIPELPAEGPEELRRLTEAFNEMQARLTRFIGERTRLLAALGHDLRSPLTAMRLRAEMVEDDETRERLAAIIAEMQEMVESTLSFARGMVTSEETRNVDLAGFLGDLCEDVSAVGGAVSLVAAPGLDVRLKPVAMRRALRNVVENAIRYGQQARILAERQGDHARIRVRDEGAGIPEADLERVFDPFVRIEKSRNLETGGTGLGLSIARTVIHAHGGEITLSNRPAGGLQVDITLPLSGTAPHEQPNSSADAPGANRPLSPRPAA